jgi:hypothetical protein
VAQINYNYIVVGVLGIALEKTFFLEFADRYDAKIAMKKIDDFKKNLSSSRQERINFHIWGQMEMDMLKEYDTKMHRAIDIEWIIEQCDLLTRTSGDK